MLAGNRKYYMCRLVRWSHIRIPSRGNTNTDITRRPPILNRYKV
jgi:hypothetical protein